jgi:excisionase family DNA binding protein
VTSRLLTTREVASWLGLSPETVLRHWRAGDLPGYRIATNALRFDEAELRAWLAGRRESTIAPPAPLAFRPRGSGSVERKGGDERD